MKPFARLPLVAASSLMAAGLLHAGVVDKSYRDARAVLDAGIKAAGGLEALRAIKEVRWVGSGTAYAQGQSLVPETLITRQVEVTSDIDLAGGRSRTETVTSGTGIVTGRTVAVLNGEQSFGYNIVTRALTPTGAGAVAAGRTGLRRNPAALLLTALGRAETLRSLGPRAITFSDTDGTQIGLTFDAAGLLASQETLADNAVLGDALTELVFSEYRDVPVGSARVKLPGRVVTRVAGDTTLDIKYSKIEANMGLAAATLAAPPNAERVTPAPAVPGGIAVTKLGDDAYLIGGGSHHSLAVGFKDGVTVVEAPLSDERSLAVLAKVNELFPGKSIRLVPTHYHFDHSGGIRTYVAWGLPILTTPGNKGFIEKMAATPHTIRPDTLSKDPKKPNIETFTGKKVISDGTRTLELYDVGPNPHVKEMVIAYLPKEKTLFVADLISLNPGPFAPAAPALVDFSEKIGKLGLAVDVLVPAHGRQGTMEDLKAALAAKAAND